MFEVRSKRTAAYDSIRKLPFGSDAFERIGSDKTLKGMSAMRRETRPVRIGPAQSIRPS